MSFAKVGLFAAALLAMTTVVFASDELMLREIDTILDSGDASKIVFEETERGENYSIARVVVHAGPVGASLPVVFESFRRIGESRGFAFMLPLKEWSDEGDKLYKFGFTNSRPLSVEEAFGADVHPDVTPDMLIPVQAR